MGEVIKLRVASSEDAVTLQSASGSLAVKAVSPRVEFERTQNGSWMNVTDVDGEKTTFIPDGVMGPQGPQGDDYVLTDADKTEIAGKVLTPVSLPIIIEYPGCFVTYDGGSVWANETYNVSQFVDVSGWDKIRYMRTMTTAEVSSAGMAFYNGEKVRMEGVKTVLNQESIGYYGLYEVDVPEGAKYARFTMLVDTQTYGEFVLYGIRNALSFDTTPTANSINAVTSGGVYAAVSAKADPVTVETVSGTDPVIVGSDNHRYVCGTVDTLTLTPPSSGIVDVVFTSGTTPTVLSVPNTVKWPGWFDPTSLDASTTYELNIMDGVYGAVAAWT